MRTCAHAPACVSGLSDATGMAPKRAPGPVPMATLLATGIHWDIHLRVGAIPDYTYVYIYPFTHFPVFGGFGGFGSFWHFSVIFLPNISGLVMNGPRMTPERGHFRPFLATFGPLLASSGQNRQTQIRFTHKLAYGGTRFGALFGPVLNAKAMNLTRFGPTSCCVRFAPQARPKIGVPWRYVHWNSNPEYMVFFWPFPEKGVQKLIRVPESDPKKGHFG